MWLDIIYIYNDYHETPQNGRILLPALFYLFLDFVQLCNASHSARQISLTKTSDRKNKQPFYV